MESSDEAAAAVGSEERRFAASLTGRYSDWVVEELDELPGSFLLTDPAMPGHPIVYASRGLAALTGYARREVLGRNARVFQGAATDRAAVAGVREAVRGQRAHQVAILNYRRDGSPHWVLLHVAPVFHAADGRVLHFLAVQVPIHAAAPRVTACRPGRPAVFAACREEARVEEELPCASHAGEVFVDRDSIGMEAEEPRVASDCDKEKALSTASSIFSALNRYSKLTGLVVCGKRCDSVGIPALSSSLNLSLGRIKQSFVLTDPHLLDMPIVYASDAFLSLTETVKSHRLASQKWVASFIKEKLRDSPNYRPRDIANDLQHEYGLCLNYSQAWRGKLIARKELYSPHEEACNQLPWFRDRIFATNSGSLATVVVLEDSKFRFFVAFHAERKTYISSSYSREEILGCNCRFLNGPGTSVEVLEEINRHICSEQACTVHLLNYRKDGSSFRDLLHVCPIRNASGKVAFHVWVHLDESAKYDFNGLTPEVWQLGAVGAVRVAVRSLSASGSLLRPSQ